MKQPISHVDVWIASYQSRETVVLSSYLNEDCKYYIALLTAHSHFIFAYSGSY